MKNIFSSVLLSLLLLPQIAFGAYTFSQGGTNNTGPYASSTFIVSDGVKFYSYPFTSVISGGQTWEISNGYLRPTTTITALLPAGFVSTASSTVETSLTLGYLTNGIIKVVNGLISLAIPDTDYQVPLTFGDGLTRTLDDVDCDTVSASTFGCLSSSMFTEFNNKVGSSSLPYIYALSGLGSIGSSTATTTANGNFSISGDLRVIGRTFLTDLYLVTEYFYNGLTGPNYTATSTTIASIFPLASSTAVSIAPGTGQTGLKIVPTNGSCAALVDIENQFNTDVFNITCAGDTSFNTLSVYNAGSTINQLGGFLVDSTSVTTLQSGLTTRSAASFGSPYNSATPLITFVKTASDDTGNFYRAGSMYVDWVNAASATRTGKLRLTLNDFNGERDVLTATSTGADATLSVSLAPAGGNVTIPYASTTALTVSGSGNALNVSSASATSTLAGGLVIETSGFVYDFTSNRVGIGTASPGGRLDVAGAGAGGSSVIMDNNTFLSWRNASGSARTIMSMNSGNGVDIKTSDGLYVRFLNSTGTYEMARFNQTNYASFGIGTSTPGAMISASSSDTAIGLMVDQRGTGDIARFLDAGSPVLAIKDGGNIGIGTTTPGTLLSLGNTGASTINITPSATSTFGFGLNISSGCYAIGGSCLTGPSQFVTVSSGVRNISGDIIATTDLVAMGGDLNAATSTTPFPISICKGANASSNALSACATSISKGGTTNSGAGAGTAGNGANVDIGGGGDNNRGTGNGGNAGNLDLVKGGNGPDAFGNDGIVTIGLAAASSGKANAGLILNGNATTTGTMYWTGLQLNTGTASASLCLDSNNQMKRNTDNETCLSSSERYKDEIVKLTDLTDELMGLDPVSFKYKEGDKLTHYGLIAEQVEDINPLLVSYDDQGLPNGIRWSHIIALLVQGHQDQEARISALENKQSVGYWPLLGLLGLLGLIPRRK